MGKIIQNGVSYSATTDRAANIIYDNTISGLPATTVQDVCDYIAAHSGNSHSLVTITTTDSDWKGSSTVTITVTGADETLTGTFDSDGKCKLKVTYIAEYTITVTDGSDVYTSTLDVTTIGTTYTVNVEKFGYKGWLTSASMSTSSYTSLDEVLADEKALRQLFTVHASVDYLVKWLGNSSFSADATKILNNDYCAKWINLRDYALDTLYANDTIKSVMDSADKYGYGEWALIDDTWQPKGNVPIMTSDTAPYGVAGGASYYSGYDYYKAFDGDSSTSWVSNGTSSDTIYYKFTNPVNVKKIAYNSSPNNRLKTYVVGGSNDGSTWVNLTDALSGINDSSLHTVKIDNDNYYLWYKVSVVGSDVNVSLSTLQFYGRTLSVSVPTMTSNSEPWGEAFGGSNTNNAYGCFDATSSTSSDGNTVFKSGLGYVAYDFEKSVIVKNIVWRNRYNTTSTYVGAVTKAKIKGSNDKTNWEYIGDEISTTDTSSAGMHYGTVDSDKSYRYIAFEATDGSPNSDGNYCVAMLQIYALDYSEREFASGSTIKYLYDHGVELESIVGSATGGTYTKDADNLYVSVPATASTNATFTVSSIDTTDYSLLRCSVGNKLYNAYSSTTLSGLVATVGSSSAQMLYAMMPNNLYLDISSVNSTNDIAVNVNNGSNAYTKYATVTEWWLE